MADRPSRVLSEIGLLLLSDNTLPSIATIVAGEPIRGSWWAHRQSHAIFRAATALADDPDIIAVPLVARKVTFVHRRLWPALLAVGLAREPWQTKRLSTAARALLARVERAGECEASGDAVRELERHLLIVSREKHTDRGAHAKVIATWKHWAQRTRTKPLADVSEARSTLEAAAAALGATASLPWTA